MSNNTLTCRIAMAVKEGLVDHGLSERQLARLRRSGADRT